MLLSLAKYRMREPVSVRCAVADDEVHGLGGLLAVVAGVVVETIGPPPAIPC